MPKFSGPRMKDGRYYSKGKKRGRPKRKTSTSTTLGTTKRQEVRNIVKKVMSNTAESKYFNTTLMSDLSRLNPLQSRNGLTAIGVLGFAVGTGGSPQMSSITYGWQNGVGNINVYELNCARLFGPQDPNAPTDQLKQNALEGSFANPAMCKSSWFLQYPQQATTIHPEYGTPIMVRMVRVKPRKQKYADLSINPKLDLFVNQYGIETGINATSFNELELTMYKVNARKYEVVEDNFKVLQPASTVATLDIAAGNTICTDLNTRGSNLRLVMNHKQPKRLFYTDAAVADAQPRDGQSNELIFFHFVNQGTNGDYSANEKEIEISCKPVSTFKDY